MPNVEKPIIVFMPEISKTHMGGTMRLGLRPTVFEPGTEQTTARKLYAGAPTIWERHRHRYEVNPALVDELAVDGFKFVGKDEKGERMQILEFERESITRSVTVQFVKKLNESNFFRSSFLPWFPSTPGVLHATVEPFTSLPWIRRCCIWKRNFARTI